MSQKETQQDIKNEVVITNTSVLAVAVNKVNDFYKSSSAFIFFMSMTTIFAFVQVILYSMNLMHVNGYYSNELTFPQSLLNWILLVVSIIGCYTGFVGGILLFRGSLHFVYWQSIATGLGFFTQALASMWFGALVSIYFLAMNFIRYTAWKNDWLEKWNWSSKKIISVGLIIFVVLMIVLNVFVVYAGDWMYQSSVWMDGLNHHFDATGAAFNITATFILLFMNRWAFFFYGTAKFFTIWNYAEAGLIVPIIQMALFLIMDITGFIGWSIHAIDEEETVVETVFE